MHFLDSCRDFVRSVVRYSSSLTENYAAYAGTMVNYQWSPEMAHLPHGTPGVRVVMGRAWGLALRTGHDMQDKLFSPT
jgi:hypothetical protein